MRCIYILFFLNILFSMVGCQTPQLEIKLDKPIYVVVHPDNPIEEISTRELRKIYLGKKGRWNNAAQIHRYDYTEARKNFYEKVLGISMVDMTRHWNTQKYRAGSLRPREVRSTRELYALMRNKKGAIGYVISDNMPQKVKVIATFGSKEKQ